MKLGEFNFDLPQERIAQRPLAERESSRMLLLDRDGHALTDLRCALECARDACVHDQAIAPLTQGVGNRTSRFNGPDTGHQRLGPVDRRPKSEFLLDRTNDQNHRSGGSLANADKLVGLERETEALGM